MRPDKWRGRPAQGALEVSPRQDTDPRRSLAVGADDLACRPGECPALTMPLVEIASRLRLYCDARGACAGDLVAWRAELVRAA